ncbi:MAG: tetratricopeptide repeat protein, partial [Candidatus Sumerlaeota bacterium]
GRQRLTLHGGLGPREVGDDAAAALEAYENAIGLDSASPEAKFNAGCAHYALGEYDEALRRFRDTVATPGTESELLDQAEYNIGRTLLERGQRDLQSNPQQAMQSLEQAEELFEGVARQRPEDRDAVRNLEFTRQTLRNLRDEMRRQEQMQQAQQQIADDLNELAEEQVVYLVEFFIVDFDLDGLHTVQSHCLCRLTASAEGAGGKQERGEYWLDLLAQEMLPVLHMFPF